MAADDWIKMRVHLRDDPGVAAIKAATGLDLDTIVGKLHLFWSWADSHVTECPNGDGKAPSISPSWVDEKMNHEGFAEGLVRAGWARFTTQGIVLPRYTSNNGTTGKSRAQANRRQSKRRAGVTEVSRSERDKNETRGEERREEKNTAPPPPPTSALVASNGKHSAAAAAALISAGLSRARAEALGTAHTEAEVRMALRIWHEDTRDDRARLGLVASILTDGTARARLDDWVSKRLNTMRRTKPEAFAALTAAYQQETDDPPPTPDQDCRRFFDWAYTALNARRGQA